MTCPECQVTSESRQALGLHRWHAHGVRGGRRPLGQFATHYTTQHNRTGDVNALDATSCPRCGAVLQYGSAPLTGVTVEWCGCGFERPLPRRYPLDEQGVPQVERVLLPAALRA